jgi:hypothetical protein
MKKSDALVKRELRRLRRFIDSSNDPIDRRIAYVVETAIRWARQDTVGWPTPLKDALANADLLRTELARTKRIA